MYSSWRLDNTQKDLRYSPKTSVRLPVCTPPYDTRHLVSQKVMLSICFRILTSQHSIDGLTACTNHDAAFAPDTDLSSSGERWWKHLGSSFLELFDLCLGQALDLEQILAGRLGDGQYGAYSRCFELGNILHVDPLTLKFVDTLEPSPIYLVSQLFMTTIMSSLQNLPRKLLQTPKRHCGVETVVTNLLNAANRGKHTSSFSFSSDIVIRCVSTKGSERGRTEGQPTWVDQ